MRHVIPFLLGLMLNAMIAVAAMDASATTPATIPPGGWIPETEIQLCGAPGGERPFSVQPYLTLAAKLQALPHDQAIEQLRQWASVKTPIPLPGSETGKYEFVVDLLCRMLFEPDRLPNGYIFYALGGTKPSDWPATQVDFVDNVPFLAGYALHPILNSTIGRITNFPPAESASDYLDYCVSLGKWTTRRYAPKDNEALQKALDTLLKSPAFKRPLTMAESKWFTDQIASTNIGLPTLWIEGIQGGNYIDGHFNPYDPNDTTAGRGIGINDMIILVDNGTPPYRYTMTWTDPYGKIISRSEKEQLAPAAGADGQAGPMPVHDEVTIAEAVPQTPSPTRGIASGRIQPRGTALTFGVTDAKGLKVAQTYQFMQGAIFAITRPVLGTVESPPAEVLADTPTLGRPAPAVAATTAPSGPVAAWLVTNGPVFKSWADYGHEVIWPESTYAPGAMFESLAPRAKQTGRVGAPKAPVPDVEVEIRRTNGSERVARLMMDKNIPFSTIYGSPGGPGNGKRPNPYPMMSSYPAFTPEQVQQLASLPPGDYQVAVLLEGKRVSNVASVIIDPAFDVTKAPTFEFGYVEPTPAEKSGRLVLWVVGPTPRDDGLMMDQRNDFVASPQARLFVDGEEHTTDEGQRGGGMMGTMPSGQQHPLFDGLTMFFQSVIDGKSPHTYQFRMFKMDSIARGRGRGRGGPPVQPSTDPAKASAALIVESAPFRMEPGAHPLNDAWDKATPKIKDAATSAVPAASQ